MPIAVRSTSVTIFFSSNCIDLTSFPGPKEAAKMSNAFLPPTRTPTHFQHTGFVGCQHRQAGVSCPPVLQYSVLQICPVLMGAVSVHQAVGLSPFLTMVVVHFLHLIALHCCSYLEPQKGLL